jgi:ADP-heptose:LPS heptosyltransferase
MSKKILIIRFSSIGDIVLTSPVIRCLHEQIKDVEIHFLTKKKFSSIVEINPYLGKVYTIDKNVSEVIHELQAETYDHIVDLHNNLRSWQVIVRLMKPYSNFKKLNFRKWLFVRFKAKVMPHVHIVDRYMKAVEQLGVNNDGKGLDFFITPGEEVDRGSLPAPFKSGYIGFVIGGKHNTKILPPDKVTEICIGLQRPVILLGGPEDAARGDAISTACGEGVMNSCGKYSLMQSASLVKQADFIISNDTGLMHIAAAFRKPTVSVWGNTLPELGMYPYLPAEVPHLVSEVNGLDCKPCSKIGFDKCPKGHFRCMREQDTDAIVKFVMANSPE